jgi:hypothetical protein
VVAVFSRLIDWFWRRSDERAARAQSGVPSARALELIGRATLASEVAVRTERPPEPFASGNADAVAAELYRESLHWSLLAHVELDSARAGESDESRADADAPSLDVLLDGADRALLARAAGGEDKLERLRADVRGSYRTFAELDSGPRRELVERLERAAQAVLTPLASLQTKLEHIWVRRVIHVLGVLLAAGAITLIAGQVSRAQQRQHDYAVHATWTTSSRYPQGGCESPKQECPGGENYFFHTLQEPEPWVMFDLGRERRVSAVEVDNRLDCCAERAVPLAIEVSSDKKTWHEVARHTTEFTSMRESFSPVRARYVRFRVPVPLGLLHLSRVHIYP